MNLVEIVSLVGLVGGISLIGLISYIVTQKGYFPPQSSKIRYKHKGD